MRLLKLVTLRSMYRRKSRSILTLFGIIIGVAAIFSINHVNEKAFVSLTEFFEGTSGKVQLEISSASFGESFQEEILTVVRETEGVKSAVSILETTALVRSEDEEKEPLSIGFSGLGQEGFTLYAIHPSEDRELRDYILKEGEMFQAEDEAKILLVYDYAMEKEIRTGDRIRIQMEHGVEEMLVSGLLLKEGAGMTNLGKFGIIPLAYGQKIQGKEGRITRIDLISSEPVGNTEGLENLKERLQAELGDGVLLNYPGREGEDTSQMLGGYQISLNFMAGIALFVGAFLIYNALSMTVAERKKEIGVLRCVHDQRADDRADSFRGSSSGPSGFCFRSAAGHPAVGWTFGHHGEHSGQPH